MLTMEKRVNLFRREKAALDWPSMPYEQTFKEWNEGYLADYMANHRTVDVKVAMAEADLIVEEANLELLLTTEEESDMETNTATVTPADPAKVKRDAKNARRRQLRAAAKSKPKSKTKSKAKTPRSESKLNKARAIYAKLKASGRAKVMTAFINRLGISKACASTYYQSCKAA